MGICCQCIEGPKDAMYIGLSYSGSDYGMDFFRLAWVRDFAYKILKKMKFYTSQTSFSIHFR